MLKFLIFVLFLSGNNCFNDKDIELISSLNNRFATKKCILVSNKTIHELNIAKKFKKFSERNIYGLYLNFEELFQYFVKENLEFDKTMIILKIDNNSELNYTLEELNLKVSPFNISPKFTWILILPKNASNITKNNFHVPFNVEFLLIHEMESKFTITEIYQVSKDFNMTHTHFGHFHNKSNFEYNKKNLLERRNNLQKRVMIMEIRDQGLSFFLIDCFHFELWNDLEKLFNFSTITFTRKEIQMNKSIILDISLLAEGFHSVTQNKENLFGPLLRTRQHLYIRDIGQREKTWTAYLKPFEKDLWIALAAWILVSVISFAIIGWLGFKCLALQGYDLLDYGLSSFSVLCSQGLNEKPENPSSQIAKTTIFIACTFILPAYSAFIISFLTVERTVLPFTDFESFVKDGTYKFMAPSLKFTIQYFKESNDPTIKEISEKYMDRNYDEWPATHEGAIDLLCTREKITFIAFNYMLLKYSSPCKIIIVSPNLMTIYGGLRLENTSLQYKKPLSEKIVRFREAGVITHMEKRLLRHDSPTERTTVETIDIATTKSLLAILTAGIIISIIFLFIEKCYNNFQQPHCKSFTYRVEQ